MIPEILMNKAKHLSYSTDCNIIKLPKILQEKEDEIRFQTFLEYVINLLLK